MFKSKENTVNDEAEKRNKVSVLIHSFNTNSVSGTSISTDANSVVEHFPISADANSVVEHFPISTDANAVIEHFRPVTPNEQIIGSLWDDINKELEKYKEAKKNLADPNLSPRSHYETSEFRHSISNYRLQSSIKRGMHASSATSKGSLNDLTLPEKRQRSESDSGTNEHNGDDKKDQPDSTSSTIGETEHQKRLHGMVSVQQDQICQASRALSFCLQNDYFRGGKEEVDARRALLISSQRRQVLLSEYERITNGQTFLNLNEPKGTLELTSICLRLSREYITSYRKNAASANIYNFIVLLKCGEQMFHTSLKSSDEGIMNGFLVFSHRIPIVGISPGFVCNLEVHSLKSLNDGEAANRNARSKKGTWRRMVISTPLNSYMNTLSAYSTRANVYRPIGVIESGFQPVGQLAITRQSIMREKFVLTNSVYPLDGCCMINMDCHPDPNWIQQCQHRSFLSIYQIISGMGSWNRCWCVLGKGEMNFWRYPEDETTKNPFAHVKLSLCVSQVTPISQSAASFPNSMQLDVMNPSGAGEECEKKECIRMLFAADSPEERENWIQGINQAIKNTNIWRSTKRKLTNATEVK